MLETIRCGVEGSYLDEKMGLKHSKNAN